jgi:hypothetical protein
MKFAKFIFAAALLTQACGTAFAEGAIAVDDQAGDKPSEAGWGIGFGDSKETAQAAALKKCQAAGNEHCKVVVWFRPCGAYASSAEKYGVGWGSTEDAAKGKALEACGNNHCKVVASDCED